MHRGFSPVHPLRTLRGLCSLAAAALCAACTPSPRYGAFQRQTVESEPPRVAIVPKENTQPASSAGLEQAQPPPADSGQAPAAGIVGAKKRTAARPFFQEGTAVYYAAKFQGRRTASGERFDAHKFTAAHRTLPFNTMVRVTNLDNDKSVVVRINDRGPFGGRHIIDLSPSAARAIGLGRQGVARVRLEAEK